MVTARSPGGGKVTGPTGPGPSYSVSILSIPVAYEGKQVTYQIKVMYGNFVVPSKPVQLQKQTLFGWTTIAEGTTGADGIAEVNYEWASAGTNTIRALIN